MEECPQFAQRPFAVQLRERLHESKDQILCASLGANLLVLSTQVLGTQKGQLHFLDLINNEGTIDGEFKSAILDVHCTSNKTCAFSQANKVGLVQDGNLSYTYELPNIWTVKAIHHHMDNRAYLLAASQRQLWVLMTGKLYFGRVSTTDIWEARPQTILALAVHLNYSAVLTNEDILVLDLPSGVSTVSIPLDRLPSPGPGDLFLTCAWVSPSTLVLATSHSYCYFHLEEPDSEQTPIVCSEFNISKLGVSMKEFIVISTPERSLKIYNSNGKVVFTLQNGCNGILTTYWECDSFYIITDREITQIGLISEKEQFEWYVSHQRYYEALDFSNAEGLSRDRAISFYSEWMKHTLITKNAKEAMDVCRILLNTDKIQEKELIDMLTADEVLVPLLTEVKGKEISLETASIILSYLLRKGEEQYLIFFIRNWPLHFITDSPLMNPLLSSPFLESKYELLIRRREFLAAFQVLLDAKMLRIFRVFEEFPAYVDEFIANMTVADMHKLLIIDSNGAINCLADRENVKQTLILSLLPEDMRLLYVKTLANRKKPLSLPSKLVLLEDFLVQNCQETMEFLANSRDLHSSVGLELCQKYQFIPGQILILSRLGRISDLLPLLKADIPAAVEYLKRNFNQELWEKLVEEMKGRKDGEGLMELAYVKGVDRDGICDAIDGSSVQTESVLSLLSNLHHYRAMYTHTTKSVQRGSLYLQYSLTSTSRQGKFIKSYTCAYCLKAMEELGLFRKCGHHIHLECEIDEDCRLCERR